MPSENNYGRQLAWAWRRSNRCIESFYPQSGQEAIAIHWWGAMQMGQEGTSEDRGEAIYIHEYFTKWRWTMKLIELNQLAPTKNGRELVFIFSLSIFVQGMWNSMRPSFGMRLVSHIRFCKTMCTKVKCNACSLLSLKSRRWNTNLAIHWARWNLNVWIRVCPFVCYRELFCCSRRSNDVRNALFLVEMTTNEYIGAL